MASYKKRIRQQGSKLPKYKVRDEVYQNQNIAKAEAFGADRDVQMAQQDIDSGVAAGAQQAKDITTSSSALLQALTNIQTGGFSAKRALAEYESGTLRRQKLNTLYGINKDVVGEEDKAFQQNEYAPWELEYRRLQGEQANRRQLFGSIAGGVLTAAGTIGGALVGGPAGAAFGAKIGQAFMPNKGGNNNSPVYNDPAEFPSDIS